jgi:hypothetical protein
MCLADSEVYCLTGDPDNPDKWFWRFEPGFVADQLRPGDPRGVAGVSQNLRTLQLDCYPNPFTRQVVVRWQVSLAGNMSIRIFDIAGREVRRLYSGYCQAGEYSFSWNGATDSRQRAATGIYLVRMDAGGQSITRKLILE